MAVYNYDLRQGAHPTLQGPLFDQEKLSIRTAQIRSTPIPLLFFHLNQSHLHLGEGRDLFLGKCLFARGIQRNETNIHLRLPC